MVEDVIPTNRLTGKEPLTGEAGLTRADVERRQQRYGLNLLPQSAGESALTMFVRQFHSPFIYVLLAAALVSFALDHTVSGIFIFIVLLINATIGTVQEYSAQQAAVALKKMVPQYAAVIRDGIHCRIDAEQLVPGDRVLVISGDRVPADIELSYCQGLLVDESILTGESLAAAKQVGSDSAADSPISERRSTVFAGTMVCHGRGQGTVVGTGSFTQIGQIAAGVSDQGASKPPLLQRIERFTLRVSYAVLVVIALLFVIAALRGGDLTHVFLLGVALAVSAIPEGFPQLLPSPWRLVCGVWQRSMSLYANWWRWSRWVPVPASLPTRPVR